MKIWFDKNQTNYNNFIQENFLLSPFFNYEIVSKNKDFISSEKWVKEISSLITYVDINDADILIYHDKLNIGIQEYVTKNKKTITFFNDDKSASSNLPECVDVYRTSIIGSKRKANEFSLPAWSRDFTDTHKRTLRIKSTKPIVSFCGAITNPLRHLSLLALTQNNNIKTNFIVRDAFWGGNTHDKNLRNEYINNMIDSDLVLCVAGAGNFSFRLYECMSLGRVPIILNTDLCLPCDDIINWKEISIWVEDIEHLTDNINTFWNHLNDSAYAELQNKIRNIYEELICPSGFTKYLCSKY